MVFREYTGISECHSYNYEKRLRMQGNHLGGMSVPVVILMHPDSKIHGANKGPTWVLSPRDGPHVGPMNIAIRAVITLLRLLHLNFGLDKQFFTPNLASVLDKYWPILCTTTFHPIPTPGAVYFTVVKMGFMKLKSGGWNLCSDPTCLWCDPDILVLIQIYIHMWHSALGK